jgi:8-oxo-dGTP pyrophosphatase MutT (NUDIX family)
VTNEENPWRTLSSRTVYQNPWFRLREDKVLNPKGGEGIYAVVEPKRAVGVLAVTHTENVVLVGQYRYAMECYSWEIIAGGSETGEDLLFTAKRELREEAGLEAESWSELQPEIHLSNCFTSERGYIYLAQNLKSVPAAPDDTEELRIRECSLSEVRAMIDSGEIVDAMTIIAIFKYCQLKKDSF